MGTSWRRDRSSDTTKPIGAPGIAAIVVVGLAFAVWLSIYAGKFELTTYITPGTDGPSSEVIEEDFGPAAL